MSDALQVSLSAWVVQDGNYGDFREGRRYAFALEFWEEERLVVRHPAANDQPCSLTPLGGWAYAVKGKVAFVGDRWWVLDVGLPIYTDRGEAPGPVGTPVRGKIGIAIDHFSYFERLSRESGAPALIYDWRIDAIALDGAPWVEVQSRMKARDRTRQSWRSVKATDAWKDDDGHASYLMTCTRLPEEPRRTR